MKRGRLNVYRANESQRGGIHVDIHSHNPSRRRRHPERVVSMNTLDVKLIREFIDDESASRGDVARTEEEEVGRGLTLAEAMESVIEYGPWDNANVSPGRARTSARADLYPADAYQDPRTGEYERVSLHIAGHEDAVDLLARLATREWTYHRQVGAWVSKWEERDRLVLTLYWGVRNDPDASIEIGTWSDDDARQMFEDGFFDRRDLEDSMMEYALSRGLWRE